MSESAVDDGGQAKNLSGAGPADLAVPLVASQDTTIPKFGSGELLAAASLKKDFGALERRACEDVSSLHGPSRVAAGPYWRLSAGFSLILF